MFYFIWVIKFINKIKYNIKIEFSELYFIFYLLLIEFKMVYLKYKMFGNKKKIKINAIEHNNDKSVIQHDEKHY